MKRLLLTATFLAAATSASAEGFTSYVTDEAFDDVIFSVESAILEEGLVIDSVSHVGDMLERTKGDVGSDVTVFLKADVFNFCSATVSRTVMEADPMNIMYCPYGIFVLQSPDAPDQTTVGYRTMPDGPMKEVEAMLDGIVKAALGQ